MQTPKDEAPLADAPLRWGAGWIEPEDYAGLVAVMEDTMPPTHADWHAGFVERTTSARARGYAVYRAPLRRDAFVAWCAAQGLRHDHAARQAFATEPAHWECSISPN